MKRFAIVPCLVILVAGCFWYVVFSGKTEPHDVLEPDVTAVSSWTWENPYTSKQAVIPSGWKKVENEQLHDAVLALQHESGKGLIYITYDEPVNNLSLPEYIEAVKPMNQKEFGVSEFAKTIDKDAREFYQAEGAKYMGDNLVSVDIRIWSDGSNGFWETVEMTNMEYKTIEYDGRELVEILTKTTL